MFDIGFWELVVVGIVALVVVGPQRLPGLVRTVGYWVGRARGTVNAFQHEINREVHNADILRREREDLARLEQSIRRDAELDRVTDLPDTSHPADPPEGAREPRHGQPK